jgi:serine/threonine protein kinase
VSDIHRDVKSTNVLLDEGCRDRIGDFGITKSPNDINTDITVTHMQTEHVLGTQVYMTLSMKVDSFSFGLVIIETLTGLLVLNPDVCHCNLLEWFEEDLDNPTNLQTHLDKKAYWDQEQESIGRLNE